MNTNQLKRFAKEARIKLRNQISQKLDFVQNITEGGFAEKYKSQLHSLNTQIKEIGREQVIEMVAYTWFNRLMALRFMDANGYNIPKVVTPAVGMSNPEILQNALAGSIDPDLRLDTQRLNELLDNKTAATDAHTQAYKMLLVAACNQAHTAMPFMFERISDYTELLLPDDLLSDFSIVADVRNGMSEEDCQQEEVIGWLYQFYIADKKDDVFNGLKKNIKITAENIPAATQLFTPRWIVRYMVENTLGKLWLSLRPLSKLRDFMPYYIESPEGNAPPPLPDDLVTTNNHELITKITFIDPCQGSGHVLVYAFDLFTKIYEEEGYNAHEIPALILKNNLFGIDIDPRAAQLAAFALTMKARNYYTRFLRKPVLPNVVALENVNEDTLEQVIQLPIIVHGKKIDKYSDLSLHLLTQADNFGSLIQIEPEEVTAIKVQEGSIWQQKQEILRGQAALLARQFHCVVTNPPYLGGGGMNASIKSFVEKFYPKSKADLMACFMERCLAFNPLNGKTAMINQHSWMFLSSYADLRPYLIDNFQFENMLHLGPRTFPEIGGEVVQNTAFVFGKYTPLSKGAFIRLTDFSNAQLKDDKTIEAIKDPHCGWFYTANQKDFEKIPDSPIAYWIGYSLINSFKNGQSISTFCDVKSGLSTGDNEKFIRFWSEISNSKFFRLYSSLKEDRKKYKWFPYNKGGGLRKWYGNNSLVVNWENEASEIRKLGTGVFRNESYYFKKGITWSGMSSFLVSYRFVEDGSIFDSNKGPMIFINNGDKSIYYYLAFLNSKISSLITNLLNPTVSTQIGDIVKIPILEDSSYTEIHEQLSENCVKISRTDWNQRETSWDFQQNELIRQSTPSVKTAFEAYKSHWTEQFYELHKNEEELNRQFIDIYGLQDELTPSVPLSEITILQEEVKIVDNQLFIDPVPVILQLISYGVGCLFGRYSLDKVGLILANQGDTLKEYFEAISGQQSVVSFTPDEDNIIPVLDDEWFNDDIVGRFRIFLKTAFGEAHFEENLRYIEDTLGKDLRKYLVKDFYNDHIKRYKKRPIYWLFSSPKGHFKALIYMHRYQADLCSKLLNDYLQAYISKLESAKQTQTILTLRADISAREKALAEKEIDRFEMMLKDCRTYEKTLFNVATQKIEIDLDDGVKVNYQKFKEVLVPIKGLEKEE